MNNKKVLQGLIKHYNYIDFDYKSSAKNQGNITADLNINGLPGGVVLDIVVYDSGSSHITFIFDQVDESLELYELINEYNSKKPYLTLSIRKNDNGMYLEAHGSIYSANDEKQTLKNLIFIIEYINTDDNLNELEEILKYIKA